MAIVRELPRRSPARRPARSRSGRSSRPSSATASAPRCSRRRPGWATSSPTAAQALAVRIAEGLGVVGMLAVELFETADGVLVNELAMRPHNSGHWTIEGARTSQFEQHLRAVLDLPLGDTAMTAPVVVMANVLGGAAADRTVPDRAGRRSTTSWRTGRREAAPVRQGRGPAARSGTSPRSAATSPRSRAGGGRGPVPGRRRRRLRPSRSTRRRALWSPDERTEQRPRGRHRHGQRLGLAGHGAGGAGARGVRRRRTRRTSSPPTACRGG